MELHIFQIHLSCVYTLPCKTFSQHETSNFGVSHHNICLTTVMNLLVFCNVYSQAVFKVSTLCTDTRSEPTSPLTDQ